MTYKRRAPWSSSGPAYKRKRRQYTVRARRPSLASVRRQSLNARSGGYLGLERKFLDTSRAAINLTAPTNAAGGEVDPATDLCLNGMQQGSGESNRIGRKATLLNITVRGNVRLPARADVPANTELPCIMVALVLDKQTNGAQLASENVFTNPSADARLATQPFRNLEYNERYQVLKTVKINAQDWGTMATGYDGSGDPDSNGSNYQFTMYCDLKRLVTQYVDNTGVINDIVDNSIHMIAYTNNVGMAPALSYNARLRFVG